MLDIALFPFRSINRGNLGDFDQKEYFHSKKMFVREKESLCGEMQKAASLTFVKVNAISLSASFSCTFVCHYGGSRHLKALMHLSSLAQATSLLVFTAVAYQRPLPFLALLNFSSFRSFSNNTAFLSFIKSLLLPY